MTRLKLRVYRIILLALQELLKVNGVQNKTLDNMIKTTIKDIEDEIISESS